jgi:hypothetical protein
MLGTVRLKLYSVLNMSVLQTSKVKTDYFRPGDYDSYVDGSGGESNDDDSDVE